MLSERSWGQILTRHKISDRGTWEANNALSGWTTNAH